MPKSINITVIPPRPGEPVMVRMDGGSVTDNTDEAAVVRAMLQSAAYMFTQGQPVKFGPEIPLEVLR